jgi:PAS domain S-box-containing protein
VDFDLHFAGLVLGALLLGAGGHALRDQPRRLWAAAWASIVATGFLATVGWIELPGALFLSAVFPGAQLAGALAFTRGKAPTWIAPATVVLALVSAEAALLDPRSPMVQLTRAIAPLVTFAAAVLLLIAARGAGWPARLVALPTLLIGAVGVYLVQLQFPAGSAIPAAHQACWLGLAVFGLTFQLRQQDYWALVREDQQRRVAEEALEAAHGRFRALTESTFDLVAELDAGGAYVYVNPRFEDVLGYPPASMLGRPSADFLDPEDVQAAALFGEQADQSGRASDFVLRARHRDGGSVWLEAVVSRFETGEGEEHWVLNARDATQRKQEQARGERTREILAERVADRTAELRDSDARFRALADHAPLLIAEFDGRGRYTFANASFRDLLGIEPAELIGQTAVPRIHPDDLALSAEKMGTALTSLGTADAVHRLRHADGSWRWFENTGRAYTTGSDELRFVSIGRDITEERRQDAERRRLQAHMEQAQRLESLHVLAGGIAHDFNNLLTVILGNASILEAELATTGDASHRLGRIQAAGRHAEALTQQLLAYSGKSVRELHPLDLSHLIAETEDLLRASVSNGCRLDLDLEAGLPLVEGDSTELRQVLLNLVSNAAAACESGGGSIQVRTGSRAANAVDLAHAFGTTTCVGDRWVLLEVTDDGPGMDEETRERILEPFYTTRSAGRGLGLAVVLGIATAHHGCLSIESERGQGSTFRLLLPASSRTEAWAPAARQEAAREACEGRVLVVDDDEAVRELTQVFLERAGFDVETTGDGRRALQRAEEMPPLDYVVLDLAMPDLSGAAVLRAQTLYKARKVRMPV